MKKSLRKDFTNWFYIIIALYILIFLTIRLINVTDFPLNVDERRHIIRAQLTIAEGDIFIGLRESLKQLYIWLVALALPFFQNHILAARFTSILMGLGAAGICYKLSTTLYSNRHIALLAALYYLISPMVFFYDRLAYTESVLTLLMGASILLSFKLWQNPTIKWAVALGVIFALAVLAKTYAVFYYITPILCWLILDRNISWTKILKLLAIVYGVTLIAWLPIAIVGTNIFNEDHTQKLITDLPIISWVDTISNNLIDTTTWIATYLTTPFFLMLLFSLILIAVKRDKVGFILTILLFVPLVGLALALRFGAGRYAIPTIVPITIIIAWGINNLAQIIMSAGKSIIPEYIYKVATQHAISLSIFLLLCLPSLQFNYLTITNVPESPLPSSDKGIFVEGRFSGYGIKESAKIIGTFADQFPELIILQGTNMMDTVFSLDVIGMSVYLQNSKNISYKTINDTNLHTLDAYAQQAPTFTLGTFDSKNETIPALAPLFKHPQAWEIASFTKPGERYQVKLYQWLLWPDFAMRWLQQGGDPEPNMVWHPPNDALITTEGTVLTWSQTVNTSPEKIQQRLIQANVEYIFVTPNLVANHPEFFAPYIMIEGSHLKLIQPPPNWRLAYAYPNLNCEWCIFYIKAPDYPTEITFADTIALAGYDTSQTNLSPGESLHITLYWHTLNPPPEAYTVFVHLIDAQGQLVKQIDQQPLQGMWPSNYWRTDDKLADRYTLTLPSELAMGNYKVLVGLYSATTQERLTAQTEQYLILNDAVQLTTVTVE